MRCRYCLAPIYKAMIGWRHEEVPRWGRGHIARPLKP